MLFNNCFFCFTCLMVIIIAKTSGPNLEIVWVMNSCPQVELTDKTIQSVKNSGY